MAYTSSQWSVDTLEAQLVAEVPRASTGATRTPSTQLTNIVKTALRHVWERQDWEWMVRSGTLSISAAASSATLASDFRKFDAKWLADQSKSGWLAFVNSRRDFQQQASQYTSTETGMPSIAVVTRNTTDHETLVYAVHFAPVADQAYSMTYTYLPACPIDLDSALDDHRADNEVIPMPNWMHELWEARAAYMAAMKFRADTEVKMELRGMWKDALQAAMENNAEMMTNPPRTVRDGYGDGAVLACGDAGRFDASIATRLGL